MTKLEQLIQGKCPNGVEYKPLNEIAIIFSGMTGVSKKWADEGNCKFIDYMNAYKNMKIDVSSLQNATVKKLDQNCLQKGDILCTSASETPDECAISSVIEDNIVNNVFLDDHLFGVRFKDEYKSRINPTFINYYLHTDECRKKINKTVRGVTRFYISNADFAKLQLPVPPLEVQREIVEILDKFTLLTAELTAELTARKEQFENYRDGLLANNSNEFLLSELCNKITDGMHNLPKGLSNYGKYPVLSAQNIANGTINVDTNKYASEEIFNVENKRTNAENGDVLLTIVGAVGRLAIVPKDLKALFQRSVCVIKPNKNIINPRYLKYVLESSKLQNIISTNAHGAAQKGLYLKDVNSLKINVPSLKEQQRIVGILDRFDTLCNDISSGLPAEIEARQKQYEYYRDKLLTFKRV